MNFISIGRRIAKKILPLQMRSSIEKCLIGNYRVHKLGLMLIKYLEKTNQTDETIKVITFLKKNPEKIDSLNFSKLWLTKDENDVCCFDFKGAKLPYDSNYEIMDASLSCMVDYFLFSCFFDDDYNKGLVEQYDSYMAEGPYGYTDTGFDVTVKPNDIVIDGGAHIGVFSAYAVSKGAVVYAFEPTDITFKILNKTAELNSGGGG